MKNVFLASDVADFVTRINNLTPESQALWGKMNVGQMLAHCNVTYEMAYENKHPKPNVFLRFILKLFVKKLVTTDAPYKKNSQTAPAFKISDARQFDAEKQRLLNYLQKTLELGENYFEGKESLSFGQLTSKEWNTMMSKHLDYHLSQFGV